MRSLLHFPLHPASRRARLHLAEKRLDCALQVERWWERREGFLRLNPAGELPVLEEDDGTVVCGAAAIGEYLEETAPDNPLLGETAKARAETRRLLDWFEGKFVREVTQNLLHERLLKRLASLPGGRDCGPDSAAIRAGKANIRVHLDYIGWLADRRNWLGGEDFGLADIAAAAQLSVLDYLGDVPWEHNLAAKMWYARVKSRPAFRPLLADRWPGTLPPAHYTDLDF